MVRLDFSGGESLRGFIAAQEIGGLSVFVLSIRTLRWVTSAMR